MGQYNGNTEFVQKASSIKLTFKDVFSDMFKKHDGKDMRGLFMSGLAETTPTPLTMLREWKKPWVFIRVLFASIVILVACLFLQELMTEQQPLLGFIGPTAVPFAILIFFWELNIPRNISIYMLIFMFFIGGVFSLIVTMMLWELPWSINSEITGLIVNSIIEELAKFIAVVMCFLILRDNKKTGYILTGLLIGAAVGVGFSAFESALYYQRNDYDFYVIMTRAVLAPGGHAIWAPMYGAALTKVKGINKLKITNFFNKYLLLYLFIPITLHTARNYINNFILKIILSIIAWIIVMRLVNQGVKQIVDMTNNMQCAGSVPIQNNNVNFVASASVYSISSVMAGQQFSLTNGELVFGRDPGSCNILFPASVQGISRRHCSVSVTPDGKTVLRDLGSSTGTFLANGTRVTSSQVLNNADRFYLGSVDNMFEVRY